MIIPLNNLLFQNKKFNQKFGLCHTLLLVGAWSQAREAMDKLPKFSAASEQPVVEAMCKLIHVLIEPIYRQ
jgi:THO complex subunit 2